MDHNIKTAIEDSVRDAGQDQALADKLIAWFKEIASGNEEIANDRDAMRHGRVVYDATNHEIPLPESDDRESAAGNDEDSATDESDGLH